MRRVLWGGSRALGATFTKIKCIQWKYDLVHLFDLMILILLDLPYIPYTSYLQASKTSPIARNPVWGLKYGLALERDSYSSAGFKGQSIWCLQFSQKTNENNSTFFYHSSKVEFFVHFLGELTIPKRHFEINWPLAVWQWVLKYYR